MNDTIHSTVRTLATICELSSKLLAIEVSHPIAVTAAVSARDLYEIILELFDHLIFLVGHEHYRTQKKNPGIKVDLDKVDELGNTLHQIVVYPHRLSAPSSEEVHDLLLLKKKTMAVYHGQRVQFPSSGQTEKDAPVHDKLRTSRNRRRRSRRRIYYPRKIGR